MERVKLTAKEVLSIYTGVVFTERFEDMLKLLTKFMASVKIIRNIFLVLQNSQKT